MNIPTLREFFRSSRKASIFVPDYVPYLEGLNRHSDFMDQWGHTLTLITATFKQERS